MTVSSIDLPEVEVQVKLIYRRLYIRAAASVAMEDLSRLQGRLEKHFEELTKLNARLQSQLRCMMAGDDGNSASSRCFWLQPADLEDVASELLPRLKQASFDT